MNAVHLRPATGEDLGLLVDMLVDAFNWSGDTRFTRDEILADAHTARYLAGWPRVGDFGLVAIAGGAPVGAIWARALTGDLPGYGYVADDIPELGMAVSPAHRGHGIGSLLLEGCIEVAEDLGCRALSLSVEDGNSVARRLYERNGFVAVGREGGSDVMLLELPRVE